MEKKLYEEITENVPFQSCYSAFRKAIERAVSNYRKGS
ncbi:Integrase [Marinobacter nauticus]|uniref:Integrase n=1 Tax=Marinobacter nauticus TaxID=2743 RepID=A0A833JSQ9_MARNT|nr:Integrase [Marinobacter nauticus]